MHAITRVPWFLVLNTWYMDSSAFWHLGRRLCRDNSVIASITALLFPWLQLNDPLRTIPETSLGNPTLCISLYKPGDNQAPGSLSCGASNFRELYMSKVF